MMISRLPEFEQTVLGVRANEVLMWMMNNTNHVFLMNLVKNNILVRVNIEINPTLFDRVMKMYAV